MLTPSLRKDLQARLSWWSKRGGGAIFDALHGVDTNMVMAGNGSDDLLTIITRAFLGPADIAAYPTPSYLLYSTLIRLQNGREHVVAFTSDWTLDAADFAQPGVKLVYLANPNSPSGTALSQSQVAELARRLDCPLIVDEAYVDFAREHCIGLVRDLIFRNRSHRGIRVRCREEQREKSKGHGRLLLENCAH